MVVMNNILRYHVHTADAVTSPMSSKVIGKNAFATPVTPSRDFIERMSRYTRSSDRKNVLKTLKECNALKLIKLASKPSFPASESAWIELEQEVCRTRFDMNGIALGPGCHSSSSYEIQKILKLVCAKLTEQTDSFSVDELYREVIVRLAESNSLSESHRALDPIMGSPQLQLLTLDTDSKAKAITKMALYESNGHLHIVLDSYHSFGLFRKLDMGSGKAWIKVTATFHERSNLSTGAAIRNVAVQLPSK